MLNKKYNRLLIIGDAGVHIYPSGQKKKKVVVRCDCGNTKEVLLMYLESGHTKSCGCLSNESIKERSITHNKSQDPIYKLFYDIKKRCYNPNFLYYDRYGGRGIDICQQWLNDFMSFYNWCNDNGYQKGLQIDRINNDLGYSPENCRFVSSKVNNRNKESNRLVCYKGETKPLSEWCEIFRIHQTTVSNRIDKFNWTIEKAFTEPNKTAQQIIEKQERGGKRKSCKYKYKTRQAL